MALRTSSVQPRSLTEMSLSSLTFRNRARTSSGGVINVAQASSLCSPRAASVLETETGRMPVPRLATVVTTGMRASTGMRFRAKLQPTQPARRAVDESGFRLMIADGGKAKLGTSRRFLTRYNRARQSSPRR